MLEFRIGRVPCHVSVLFPALLTALLLCQREGLAVSCLLASLMHEAGHLLAMFLLGVPPADCTLGMFGLRIRLGCRLAGYGYTIIIALAGPLANGLFAALFWRCGLVQTAAVHLLLAGLNLLPLTGLDGGELLRCFLCLLGWEQAQGTVLRIAAAVLLVPMLAAGLWLFLYRNGNPSLIVVSLYLAVAAFFFDECEKNT